MDLPLYQEETEGVVSANFEPDDFKEPRSVRPPVESVKLALIPEDVLSFADALSII